MHRISPFTVLADDVIAGVGPACMVALSAYMNTFLECSTSLDGCHSFIDMGEQNNFGPKLLSEFKHHPGCIFRYVNLGKSPPMLKYTYILIHAPWLAIGKG